MKTISPRRVRAVIAGFALLGTAFGVQAQQAALIGGSADPYDAGFVPVPPSPEQPFTAQNIADLTDGNLATGHSFTTHIGEYTSNPTSTVGFTVRFDFDVSSYLTIDRIDFLWTGNYHWEGNNLTGLRFGYDPAAIANIQFFPGTNGAPVTIGTSLIRGSEGFDNLDNFLHNGVASIYVSTDLGFTDGGFIPSVTLDTFEVAANVTGTPGGGGGGGDGGGDGGPVSVPEPASLSLMLAGLLGAVAVRRRRKPA